MSGRRSHPRFAVVSPWEGALRVIRSVVIDKPRDDELVAVSHAPGVVGEEMSLDLLGAGASLTLKVRVVESSPVIISGSVRHRIRLRLPERCVEEPIPDGGALPVTLDSAMEQA